MTPLDARMSPFPSKIASRHAHHVSSRPCCMLLSRYSVQLSALSSELYVHVSWARDCRPVCTGIAKLRQKSTLDFATFFAPLSFGDDVSVAHAHEGTSARHVVTASDRDAGAASRAWQRSARSGSRMLLYRYSVQRGTQRNVWYSCQLSARSCVAVYTW